MIIKNKFIFLFLTISFSINSQGVFNNYEKGKLYLRNNTELVGFIKVTIDDEVKYKRTLNDKKQLFDDQSVKKIVFTNDNRTFYYKHDNNYVYLVQKKIEGKLDLYYKQSYTPGHMGPNGMMIGGGSSIIYYIGKENSDTVDELSSNVNSKDFWLHFSKYIADCKYMIDKVKDKKSIKKNFRKKRTRLVDMVNDYNSNCK
ncbi:hypothetical protein [Polaribacter sp. Hel1_85]|uniref:hypothetical protein n=1 Tax=Polaribacter sp. Hel1_85 TaxID=1250005 RepID=UPI0012E0B763|nr:hypothetical protein [Polaribacter sp. Hel1_85]